jgi:outer membrane immunogenic protein
MKTLWVGSVSLAVLGMAGAASAADMAVKAAPPPAPIAAIYHWSGFYIGANGGWGQAHACVDLVTPTGTVVDGCRNASGGIVGGQLGYRWQNGQFVFGVEGQGDWADLRASRVSLFNPAVSETAKVDALGLITGQIGYAWNATLLYLKGGAAVTGNRFDVFNTATGVGLASSSSTRWGAAVGVGFEYGFSPNWSAGVEYDHLFMGHNNNTFSVTNPILAGAINRIGEDVDMVTVRVNYRFGYY